MSKPIIAVDIDDVLSLTTKDILAYSNKRWGHNHTIEDFNEHLAQMWQVDAAEAERRWVEFMTSGAMEKYEAIPEARTALEELSKNYTLIALTSRRVVLLDLTNVWIKANYPKIFQEVHSARIYGEGKADAHKLTKGEVLKELGAEYLIDDQPKHCLGAAEVGVQAILFGEYPWNRGALAEGIVRCKDWADVLEYFDGR